MPDSNPSLASEERTWHLNKSCPGLPSGKAQFASARREVYALFQQQAVYQGEKVPLKDHVGEDWVFSDRAREVGYELWLDTTYGLKHTGDYQLER